MRSLCRIWLLNLTLFVALNTSTIHANDVKEVIKFNVATLHDSKILETHFQLYTNEEFAKDGKFTDVLDAGHGGHDPGCKGSFSLEKEVALSIALLTGKKIEEANPTINVIYTRNTDVFIPLHKRISIANKNKADVFISIHCNYVGNPKICGTETYVMGLHRAEENLKVAKRENSSVLFEDDFQNNYEGFDPNSPVGHIILSAYQNLYLDQSIILAASIEDKFIKRGKYKSRGVKQAGFVVLRRATMPSILVETGFLSNKEEEEYLNSKDGKDQVSSSICQSIEEFHELHSNINILKDPSKENHPKTIYTIQVGVFSSGTKNNLINSLSHLAKVDITKVGEVYRYTLGAFGDKSSALHTLEKVKEIGITDAYIKIL